MRLKEIKIGEDYYHFLLGWLTAKAIEKKPEANGRNRSYVLCQDRWGRRSHYIQAQHLESRAERDTQKRLSRAEQSEGEQLLELINQKIGPGVSSDLPVHSSYANLRLSQAAAERILRVCGKQPIEANNKPSGTTQQEEWIRRSNRLSRQIRRALGVGKTSKWGGDTLWRQNQVVGKQNYAAKITLQDGELHQMAIKLRAKPQESSPLTQLIS